MSKVSSKLLLSLMTTMVLVGCQFGDDADTDEVEETTTEEETNETAELSIQQVFQGELSDQEPVEYTDLEGTEDILLFSPEIDETHSVSEENVSNYILFYNLVDETLKVGYSSLDESSESEILGSSNFEEHVKEYTVTDVQFTENSVIIETEIETFEFTEVTTNEVQDQDGNTYLIYEQNVDEILEKYK